MKDAGRCLRWCPGDPHRGSGGPAKSGAYTLLALEQETTIDIAVLISGSGSNLQALIDAAAADPDFAARIVLVASDRAAAAGLGRAESAGIPTTVLEWTRDRDASTAAMCDLAEAHGAEAIVLAGFMRILGPEVVRRFPNRVLNIHPSLLPAFPGGKAVPQAIEYGVKLTGVTVHFVDEEVDHGPIIAQEVVAVEDGDTPEVLHDRIRRAEHRLYPAVVKAFAQGRLTVQGRKVVWR